MEELKLPTEEYIEVAKNGKSVTRCTLRQKAMHCIGLSAHRNRGRLYTRHGKKYYRPYRNYFAGNDAELDTLIKAGYMEYHDYKRVGGMQRTYWFNRCGLDWLGSQLGIVIHDEEN